MIVHCLVSLSLKQLKSSIQNPVLFKKRFLRNNKFIKTCILQDNILFIALSYDRVGLFWCLRIYAVIKLLSAT